MDFLGVTSKFNLIFDISETQKQVIYCILHIYWFGVDNNLSIDGFSHVRYHSIRSIILKHQLKHLLSTKMLKQKNSSSIGY